MTKEVTAKLKFLRMSPRKVRLLADMVRGRKVTTALETLSLMHKRGAQPILKLLQSAMANAKNNHALVAEDMRVKTITVDGGPVTKRWMPKAHGRATPVRQRTSHVNLVLEMIERKTAKSKA